MTHTTTRRAALERIRTALTPLYDAREASSIALRLVAARSGLTTAALLSDPEAPLAAEWLEEDAARLAEGCPVQYLTGEAEFLGRRFAVAPGVLIPRPETEELVDRILRREADASALLDVGTGSGCIAATLALELPRAAVSAADISPAALEIAAANCRALGARVALRRADALGDLAEVFPGPFDVVVSNPPYIPAAERAAMHRNVAGYEPAEALFVPDDDPLRFYRAIARAGQRILRPGGALYFEIHHRAADAIRRLLAAEGYTAIEVWDDLFGKPRMTCCRRK